MIEAMLPDLDVARAVRYCAEKVPPQHRHQIRVECDVADRHLTICECRPPWHPDDGSGQWIRFPIARMHYTQKTGLWTLYWRDRNLRFHRYQYRAPSPHIQDLLDHIDSGKDPIFWG